MSTSINNNVIHASQAIERNSKAISLPAIIDTRRDQRSARSILATPFLSFPFLPFPCTPFRQSEQSITQTNGHRLRLAIVRQSSLTQLAPASVSHNLVSQAECKLNLPNTAFLVSTKWQSVVQHVILINPDSTSFQSVADADGGVQAAGVDGRGETVGGPVADADGVFFRLEFGDGADRAKDFFLHDLHVLADAREDGGLDEVAFLAVTLTTDFDFGAFLLALFNIPTYWSMYAFGDQEGELTP